MYGQQTSGSDVTDGPASALILKVITFGLVQGAVVFAVFALYLNGADMAGEPGVLTWAGLGLGALIFAGHLVVPGIIANAALADLSAEDVRDKSEDELFAKISPAYQTQHIMACAMLEGASFLNLIAYMMEATLYSLIAGVVFIVLILIRMPTLSRVDAWVQDRAREIASR